MRRQENFNLDLETDCFEDQTWFGVIPGVHVAQVGKPCVRVKVRCSCWTKKGGHFHILVQLCWENDLSILIMIFFWAIFVGFFKYYFFELFGLSLWSAVLFNEIFQLQLVLLDFQQEGSRFVECCRRILLEVGMCGQMQRMTQIITSKDWSFTRIAVNCLLMASIIRSFN